MNQTEKDAYDAANPVLVMPLDIPSLTTTERDEHVSPPKDWLIYNSTTDQLERYDGSAWVAVGGGDFPLLASASPSASSQVDFDTAAWFSSTYQSLLLTASNLTPSADNTRLSIRYKLGGAYKTTAYGWRIQVGNSAAQFRSTENRIILPTGPEPPFHYPFRSPRPDIYL